MCATLENINLIDNLQNIKKIFKTNENDKLCDEAKEIIDYVELIFKKEHM